MAKPAKSPVVLVLDKGNRIARLRLQAPPLNILTREINARLADCVHEAEAAGAVYLLIESGVAGVFSAGVSIPEHQPDSVRDMLIAFHQIFRRLNRSPLITIAAVNGHCHGGGAELALFCDFVLASRTARISFPEIKLGCLPPVASLMLPDMIGAVRTRDLLLTGRSMTGEEAVTMGLASRLLPGGAKYGPALNGALKEITGLSAAAQRLARAASRSDGRWQDGFEQRLNRVEKLYLNELMKTVDAGEGILAFMEKRKPRWTDA